MQGPRCVEYLRARPVHGIGHTAESVDVKRDRWYAQSVAPNGIALFLVDDDPLVTDSLGTALRVETEHDVMTFNSGMAALAAMPHRPPDVVITDFKMPQLDGLALLRAVRQTCPDAVLMLLTGYADKESAIRAINEVGIFQYVEKPWDLQDLLLKIQAGLERSDLTRRLRIANADLERRNQELKRSLAEVAAAHEEVRLAHERVLGAERLAAVGRVVSGIAHEIGNQLALVGYAEAIKKRAGHNDPDISEYADIIVAAQKRLSAMVTEIKDFVRGEAHDADPTSVKLEPADVSSVVEEALAILKYDKEVAVRRIVRVPGARPLARLNRGKFTQVVINLVRNAAQATRPGDEITLSLDEKDGRMVMTITDQGTGMSAEVLARLGEPFFTTRGERGTGLGIGICRRIVSDHGGELSFSSRPSAGTHVTVSLPALAP